MSTYHHKVSRVSLIEVTDASDFDRTAEGVATSDHVSGTCGTCQEFAAVRDLFLAHVDEMKEVNATRRDLEKQMVELQKVERRHLQQSIAIAKIIQDAELHHLRCALCGGKIGPGHLTGAALTIEPNGPARVCPECAVWLSVHNTTVRDARPDDLFSV